MTEKLVYDFLVGDGVPLHEGILTAVAFAAIGAFCAWGNGGKIPLTFLVQFCYSTLAVRYIMSYVMFHHGLREGIYPFFWLTTAFAAIWLVRPRKRLEHHA